MRGCSLRFVSAVSQGAQGQYALVTGRRQCIFGPNFWPLRAVSFSIKKGLCKGKMASERTPFPLRFWMLLTRWLSWLVVLASWVLHRRMGADPKRFSERLGHGGGQGGEPVIWFHAASLGEVIQIAPLASHLMAAENARILVTTTTASGADWVAKHMPHVTHRFAPIDTPRAVKRFLTGWTISAALFVEGDLQPRLLESLDHRGVPRILLNARYSRTRARFPAVFGTLLGSFALVTCRSDTIAEEFLALGLPADRVHVLPDLRLTLPKPAAPRDTIAPLCEDIGQRPVWLAASTHPADEDPVLTAHSKVLEAYPDALLILAPRHPVRGAPLRQLAQSMELVTAQRSKNDELLPATQVYIADTLGELGVFFTLSPIAFLGGSFGQEGGHTPYEPACFGTALLHGPHVKNFADAYIALRRAGAALQVEDAAHLGEVVTGLLSGDQAKTIGQAGLAYVGDTKDCLTSYLTLIGGVLKHSAR